MPLHTHSSQLRKRGRSCGKSKKLRRHSENSEIWWSWRQRYAYSPALNMNCTEMFRARFKSWVQKTCQNATAYSCIIAFHQNLYWYHSIFDYGNGRPLHHYAAFWLCFCPPVAMVRDAVDLVWYRYECSSETVSLRFWTSDNIMTLSWEYDWALVWAADDSQACWEWDFGAYLCKYCCWNLGFHCLEEMKCFEGILSIYLLHGAIVIGIGLIHIIPILESVGED